MASNHPAKAACDDDHDLQLFEASLKYVRWNHKATNDTEISVAYKDEVRLIKKVGDDSWKVKVIRTGETGIIPVKCFIPRVTVNWPYSAKNNVEVSVCKDETVGVIKKDTMWKIVKEKRGKKGKFGEKGEVPSYCFYLRKKVECPYHSEEITLKEGDVVGVEYAKGSDSSEVKVRTEDGTTGLVPRYCFYEKCEVLKSYDETNLHDIKVTEGESVCLADKNNVFLKVYVKDENGEGRYGLVPENCLKSGLKITLSPDSEEKETLVATEESPRKDRERMVGLGLGVEESKIHSTCDETDNLHHD